jgi:hypothetical protein
MRIGPFQNKKVNIQCFQGIFEGHRCLLGYANKSFLKSDLYSEKMAEGLDPTIVVYEDHPLQRPWERPSPEMLVTLV